MKGVYLGACLDRLPNYDIDYNDIDNKTGCNLICDMLSVDLSKYDFVLASPPCNYYSIANYRRDVSKYALNTVHLLPSLLYKCKFSNKPFIIENVINPPLMTKLSIFNICKSLDIYVYFIGRHTYFSNMFINLQCEQVADYVAEKCHNSYNSNNYRQGGINVNRVFNLFLEGLNDYV